ncbi:aldo/keto reductase [Lacticaseibacillus baoqingensis]|uniref:Aldo/keto reductase n=1 Tax=Lacticaseibacillus baoqingensis TaxID=2486013 RepID=A0ABW4E965_9LACO|nr:aldo/keto reductase [Lacticaseibacillus baoqingensis]
MVKIGHSNVEVPALGLGTNKVGGHNLFPNLKDDNGVAVVKEALAKHITLLDTAFMYGLGRSEELIAQALQGVPRAQVIIATKAAQTPQDPKVRDNSPAFLQQAVADALARLQTDYVDIFYIHFPDEKTHKAAAIKALAKLRDAGKLRAIGVSNFSLAQLEEANADDLVDVVEDHYSLVHRDAEKTLFPYLRAHHISFVPYFPLASGLLTGKYGPADAAKFPQYSAAKYAAIMAGLKVVRRIAQAHKATVAQVVLAWYMANPDVATVIPGARLPEQVDQNAGAYAVHLTPAEYQQIDAAFQ